ncbi:leucine-rich repeat-containing DDB_G0290503 [Olea europaea subsp. europaea]|uniref:Leucine-rich repeat-containing DDB_G0290503 n=1 Tax=Olea europaea subsp. europaea TaxID=158383 RepID=A0A8S0QG05_OLEEU|nr:leucine-rich repeat-containing DDB_G0290503 [Olea europaea subsp. europaea]
MPKHRGQKSFKSFFGSLIDTERDEELKGTKAEVDGKVEEILKALKEEEDNLGKGPVADLVKDFYNHYQSLYDQYDHLTGELQKKVHDRRGKDSSSSSSSDSDSDHSPRKKGTKNGKMENDFENNTASIKQELETAILQVADLERKLTVTAEENEALRLEYQSALSKMQEAEKIIADLNEEKLRLFTENADLSMKLESAGQLKQEKEALQIELEALKGEFSTLKEHFESAEKEGTELHQTQKETEEEKNTLSSKILQLEDDIKKAQNGTQDLVTESSLLRENLYEKERELLTLLEMHETHKNETSAHVRDLELELDTSHIQRRETEKQKNDEFSTLLTKLEDQERDSASRINDLTAENSDLNMKLESAGKLLAELNQKLEDMNTEKDGLILEKETAINSTEEKKNAEILRTIADQLKQEKEALQLELKALKAKFSTLHEQLESEEKAVLKVRQTQKATEEEKYTLSSKILQLEDEIKKAQNKIQDLVTGSSQLKEKLDQREKELLAHLEMHETHKNETSARARDLELELDSSYTQRREMEKRKDDEFSALQKKLEDQESNSLSRINDLTAQIKNTLLEVESLRITKSKLEEQIVNKDIVASAQVKDLTDQVNAKQQEMESLLIQKTETEIQLKKRVQEISEFLIQIETIKEELANKKSEQQRTLGEKESLVLQVNDLELKLNTLHNIKSELEEQLTCKNQEISKLQIQIETLKGEFGKNTEEQQKILEEIENFASRVKDLELELNSLSNLKTELEEKLKSKSEDFIQLQQETEGLQVKTTEMERASKEKEDELFRVKKQSEDRESEVSAQIMALTGEISNLQEQLDLLRTQKSDADSILGKRSKEISEFLIMIERLKEELSSKTMDGKRILGEKEGLEIKISELEKALKERLDEVIALEKKTEDVQNEASTQIAALTVQVNHLQQHIDSLQLDKNQLEVLTQRSKQESMESLAQVKNQTAELIEKNADKARVLKEMEDEYIKLNEEHKNLKVLFQNCEENFKSAKKKIEEITEQFHKDIDTKNQKVDELEENIEDLKRGLEMKEDELATLVENVRNTEVKLRLTNQKLRITEQLLTEKEDDQRRKVEKLRQEQSVLEERILSLSGTLATYKEGQMKIVSEVKKRVNETLTGFDTFSIKFEEDYGHLESRIYEIVNELEVAANWIKETTVGKDKLKNEITNLVQQLKNEKEQELLLRGKVGELEIKLQKAEGEKEILKKTVTEIEEKLGELEKNVEERDEKMNEKEQGFLSLIEEKKMAIKQLCIWIDYHRNRYDDLKEMITKSTSGRRQIAT